MVILEKLKTLFGGNSRSSTVKRNVIASFGIKGVSILVSFALVPLTIGYMSSELYGVWLTLSSVVTWLSFFDIGFSQGLKNKLTEAIAREDWSKGRSLVSTTYFIMALIFVPLCVVLEAIVPLINWTSLLNVTPGFEKDIEAAMRVLVAFSCLQMIVNVLISVVSAFQKVALSNTFVPIGNLISLIIIVFLPRILPPSLVVLSFSLAAMPVLVTIAASFVLYSSSFKIVAPRLRLVDRHYIKDLFGLGYKFFIINIQGIVVYQSASILISNVSSPLEVTSYNVAYRLMSFAVLVFTIILQPLWPAYTDAYAREDYKWMKLTRRKMYRLLGFTVLGCAIIVGLSNFLYKIWIGDQVRVPFMMTVLVALYSSIHCWVMLDGTLLVGMGKVRLDSIIVVFGMLIHIPLSLFLSKFIGCYGVIVSMIIISVLYECVYCIQVNKLLNQTARGVWNE